MLFKFFCLNFYIFFASLLTCADSLICLAEELAEHNNVQDAFVIAVEQQARERLEKLSALRKIKPVDMTALSQEVRF